MTGLLKVAKVTFLLTLIIIHFLAFGLPYIQKYQEDAIGVKESYEKSSALKMPAFTFCPFAKNLIGWKNETNLNPDQNLRLRCDEVPTSSDEVLSCIQNKTHSLSDTIQNARHGMFSEKNLATFEYWEWDHFYVKIQVSRDHQAVLLCQHSSKSPFSSWKIVLAL